MFAFIEYTMSLAYTFLLVILRTTLGKKKNMHTKQSLSKKTGHVLTWKIQVWNKWANSHIYPKTFFKIQNSRKTEHEFSYVEFLRFNSLHLKMKDQKFLYRSILWITFSKYSLFYKVMVNLLLTSFFNKIMRSPKTNIHMHSKKKKY